MARAYDVHIRHQMSIMSVMFKIFRRNLTFRLFREKGRKVWDDCDCTCIRAMHGCVRCKDVVVGLRAYEGLPRASAR